jgi:hypothetical protein
MSSLRTMIDGVGSLAYDMSEVHTGFKVNDDVLVRRQTNRSGPITSEVRIGTILALGESSATVLLKNGGGTTEKKEIHIKEISPVTLAMRRHSIQFQPAFRGRV